MVAAKDDDGVGVPRRIDLRADVDRRAPDRNGDYECE
jgi:hypothetical protein